MASGPSDDLRASPGKIAGGPESPAFVALNSVARHVRAPDGYQFCLMGLPRVAHLVVSIFRAGTPGPTLCGIDRFQKPPIGWSMADYASDGGGPAEECENCHDTREWLEGGAQVVWVKVDRWTVDMLRWAFENDGPGSPMTRQQRAWLDKLFQEAAR